MLTEVVHPSQYSTALKLSPVGRGDVSFGFRTKIELHYTSGSSKNDILFTVNGKSR